MRHLLLTTALLVAFISGCQTTPHGKSSIAQCCEAVSQCCSETAECCAETAKACEGGSCDAKSTEGSLRHVVFFNFTDDATDEQIAEVEQAFAALPDSIPSIRSFEYGHTDISAEGMQGDFTHCFLVTFDDMAGLEEYLPHPAHEEFVSLLRPILEEAFVADYIARETYQP